MKKSKIYLIGAIVFVYLAVLVNFSYAHCDTMSGPVIKDAQAALAKGEPTVVLKWVKKEDEDSVKKAFAKTLKDTKQNPKNKEKVEKKFFELLVKTHRKGEGFSFTGLKTEEPEPIILLSDKAIETGSVKELKTKMTSHIDREISNRFNNLMEKKKRMNESVEAGREYVEAYVQYMHFMEKLHEVVMSKEEHH